MTNTLTSHDIEQGELPEGWESNTLNYFCEMYQPKTISRKELVDDGPYPVFGANGQIGFYTDFNHEESEVTVTCRGATCGTVNVIPAMSWITGNAMVVRPKDQSLGKEYLNYFLQSSDFTSVISGTAQPQITRKTLSTLETVVAPRAEQERIVEILEDQLSRLDTALHSVHTVREKVAQFRRSLLHAAFTGALTGHDVEQGEVPKGWGQSTIGELASIKTGKVDANAAVENGEHAFFTCARETYRINDAPYEGKAVLVAGNGDLNVKYYEGKFNAYQRTYFLFSRDESLLRPRYLYFFLDSYLDRLRASAIGTTVKYIRLGDLRDAEIPLMPLPEQDRIVEIVEDQLSRLDASLAVADAVEERSAALRRSLLHSAFTGRLTREWREAVNV